MASSGLSWPCAGHETSVPSLLSPSAQHEILLQTPPSAPQPHPALTALNSTIQLLSEHLTAGLRPGSHFSCRGYQKACIYVHYKGYCQEDR